jgi:hypothetical protein
MESLSILHCPSPVPRPAFQLQDKIFLNISGHQQAHPRSAVGCLEKTIKEQRSGFVALP